MIGEKSYGKTILSVLMIEDYKRGVNSLEISFNDDTSLNLYDDGQNCCEYRYMTCDDVLEHFAGSTLLSIELKDGPDENVSSDEVHEIQFLEVITSMGSFIVASHNEHNGYYGGFNIVEDYHGHSEDN